MNVTRAYVSAGFALIPLQTGEKRPLHSQWNDRCNVIASAAQARSLDGNVGLAHAYCSPQPTCSLDVDDVPLADDWLAKQGIDLAALLAAPDCVQIVSGRDDRAKALYKLPPGQAPMESVAVKDQTHSAGNATILEFRCATRDGLTVQDVLPPSIHPSTKQPYRWGGNGNWRSIPDIPSELLAVWQAELRAGAAKRRSAQSAVTWFKGVMDTPRQRTRLNDMLASISADCSYERYRNVVWAILSLGWSDGLQIAQHWCRTAPHRYDDSNFQAVVAGHDLSRSPTIGTIVYYSQQEGWNG